MSGSRRCVLALDQGTTSSRAILYAEDGAVLASAQRELAQRYPQPGWVEHDPEEIAAGQIATATEALARAGVRPEEVAAIGIANQRETAVVWSRDNGRPIAPAIVWQDRRTADLCEALRLRGLEPGVHRRTGLRLDPYFSATKVAWLLDRIPGARRRAERGELAFGTIDSWLVWKLTGGRRHVTDASNASRTLLFDLGEEDWSEDLCTTFGVPRPMLPQVVDSSGTVDRTDPCVLGASIPIAGIAGDQQAALYGQRCIRPGQAKNTYGTGCFLLMHAGERPVESRHGLLGTVAWRRGGRCEHALEGSVFTGGAVVQWLRDALALVRDASEIEALAASVPDSAGVTVVPAFTGLGAPHWDAQARGAILGLTRGSTAAHIARAALESIALQSAEVLVAMQADAGTMLSELRVDGGAARNDLLMQFQADILGVPVLRPALTECTALGAALLAGTAVGLWPEGGPQALREPRIRRFEPTRSRAWAEERLADWRVAVERVKG